MYDNAIESYRGVLASLSDPVIRNRMLEKSAIYLILVAVFAAAAGFSAGTASSFFPPAYTTLTTNSARWPLS